jgi:membrane protease YdiL (CAAX protease family)
MLPLLLSVATPVLYSVYQSLMPIKALTSGYEILRDILLSTVWCLLLHSLLGSTDFFTWLGVPITVENYGAMLSSSSLIFLLYIGPVLQTAFIEDEGCDFNLPELKKYVTDALVEEMIFRTCLINTLLQSGLGFNLSLLISTLSHAAYKSRHILQGLYLANALKLGKQSDLALELAFNIALGWLLGHIYIKTASLPACALIHIFKNFMGFPDLKFMEKAHVLYPRRVPILVFYIIGFVLFIGMFKLVMTEPNLFTPWHSSLI